ncbi:MAG: ComEC/Rec2 family competence protein [Acidobacteriia bacterium]|nr:ComEC/Rec2 family competence protein [Terriglobia bacterium]
MKAPLLWVAASFCAGIALSPRVVGHMLLLAFIILGLFILAVIGHRANSTQLVCLTVSLMFAVLGVLWMAVDAADFSPNHLKVRLALKQLDLSQPSRVVGTMNRDPVKTPFGYLLRFRLHTLENVRRLYSVAGDVRLALPMDQLNALPRPCPFQYGDTVEVLVSLRKPRSFRNPGSFDYAAQLEREGIFLVGNIKSKRLLEKTGGGGGSRWVDLIYRVRHRLDAEIDRAYAHEDGTLTPAGAALKAILLGNRYFLDRSLEQDFQATGIYHVLVIAGLHVGIIAWFLFMLLRWFRIPRSVATLFIILFLVSYAWMVEARTPIVRAVIMASTYLLASLLERDHSPLNAIGLAGLLICCWQPGQLYDPGFQLSFACVLSIATMGTPLVSRWILPRVRALEELEDVGRDIHLSPAQAAQRVSLRFRVEEFNERRVLRTLSPKLIGWCYVQTHRVVLRVASLFVFSMAIQASFTLLMAVYFNRASLSAPLLNLIAIPLMGVVVPLGLIELAVSFLSHAMADFLAWGVSLGLASLIAISHRAASIGAMNVRVMTPPLSLQLVYLIFILVFACSTWFRFKRIMCVSGLVVIGAVLMVFFSPFPPAKNSPGLTLTVLDVGQGDSMLIQFPEGQLMLVDGGGLAAAGFHEGQQEHRIDIGEDVVLPYLWNQRVKRLDYIVLTHAHSDHLSGLIPVMKHCSVGELWIGDLPSVPLVRELLDIARSRGVRVRVVRRGERYLEGGAEIFILSAGRGIAHLDEANDADAVVLGLQFGHTAMMLMADLGSAMEKGISIESMSGLESTLLKVAHHGSKTATSEDMLAILKPGVAIISVASPSPFGHPSPEVLERLARHHVAVYQTGIDGALEANSDGQKWMVKKLMP